jgi:tetratricopeptide (TPR) repeat protein
MNTECSKYLKYAALLSLLLTGALLLSGCTNPEKAKVDHVNKGEAYLKESRFQEASIEFRNAVQIDDNYAAAHWGLARAYEGLQRGQEAFDELRKTVQLDANNLEARVKLGTLYVVASKGKPEILAEAEKLANEILQKDPNHIEGHILMGTIYFARNDREKGLAELNRALEIDPQRVESHLSLARFYMVTNEPAKAEEVFKRAISINGNSGLAHTEYGKFLVQANRPVEAEAELQKAVEVEPSNRNSRMILASYYLVNKQIDKAEAAYKQLADLDKTRPEGQAVLGDFYSAINRLDDAARIYQDILSKAPDYTQGRYRLGEILLRKGDKDGASAQINQVLKKDQHDRQALLLRAQMRIQQNKAEDVKAAVEDLKEVLKQEPNSKLGLYFMTQAHFGLGMIDQARAFAADLERNYPDYLPAKLLQSQLTLAAAEPKKALTQSTDLLNRLAKTAPDAESSPQLLADLTLKALIIHGASQAQLGNIEGARQDFMAAREANPRNPDVYVNLAGIASAQKKLDEAVGFYESALEIAPADFSALDGLIKLHASRNELPKAHAKLDQVLSSFPNDASLHYLKAQIYAIERNPQGTENELRKALELDPNYIIAYSALGALFINTKQEDRAITELKKVTELRPENPSAYILIGMLYDSKKDYPTAAEHYRKALEKDPDSVIAANNLAWLYATRPELNGNLDEAVRLAQGVIQKNPNVAGFSDTLGWIYYKKALYGVAVEQLRKAVAMDEAAAKKSQASPSALYRYHLGMALKEKGDKEAAKRELGLALRLADKAPFSDIEEARKALATL